MNTCVDSQDDKYHGENLHHEGDDLTAQSYYAPLVSGLDGLAVQDPDHGLVLLQEGFCYDNVANHLAHVHAKTYEKDDGLNASA